MKKILILQMRPEDETCMSEFEAILKVGQINREEAEQIRVERLEKFDLDLSKYSAIIAGGSPFDVSSRDYKKSVVQKNVEAFFNDLFDQLIPMDFPFLGICSGNGLLGNYYGTNISRRYGEQIGSVTINLNTEAENDDLLSGLPNEFTAFVGHKEACDTVPENAVLLASSDTCPVHMFRIMNNIYATQFHPEGDEEEFILRIKVYKNHGYFPPEQAEELIAALDGVQTPVPKEVLRRFVAKYHRK
jgi:GMP synthase (glutamine-hydrolysing)